VKHPGGHKTVNALVETARSASMTSSAIEELATLVAKAGDTAGAIDSALDAGEADAAARLMMAAAATDYPPTTRQVGRVLPLVDSSEHVPVLVGCASGDRIAMLLDAVEEGRMSAQRDALALFLAVELLGDSPPPPRLLTHMRLVSRHCPDVESRLHLGLAAREIQDPGVRDVLKGCMSLASGPGAEDLARRMRDLLCGPPVRVLPSRQEPKVVTGFTVRRPAEKVGRNAPCPCGSGKKYKRCCQKKDAARLSDPSPVAGLTMTEYLTRAGEFMSLDEFRRLPPREARSLDLESLPTMHLIAAVRRFSAFCFWPEAEESMDILAQRDDLPCNADGYREDLIGAALDVRAIDVARRQAEALEEPAELFSMYRLGIEIADGETGALMKVEAAARRSLGEDSDDPFNVPYALLPSYPALGIFTARACLDTERDLDSEMILEAIEEARDRLGLPPGDPAAERHERLADQRYDEMLEAARAQSLSAENESLLLEVDELRRRLDESAETLRAQERSLQRATARLAEAEEETNRPGGGSRPATGPGPSSDQEYEALGRKVKDLQALIRRSNKDRAAQRKQLAALRDRLRSAEEDGPEDPGNASDDDSEGLEVDADAPERMAVRIPVFSSRAEAAVNALPRQVARGAIRVASDLAGGSDASWHLIKRIRTVPRVYSARVGIHYRLLFELDDDAERLTVREIIHRRDLRKTLSGLG